MGDGVRGVLPKLPIAGSTAIDQKACSAVTLLSGLCRAQRVRHFSIDVNSEAS